MTPTNKTKATRTVSKTDKPSRCFQAVCFSLAGQEYGIDVGRVKEIVRSQEISTAAGMPPQVVGTIVQRGKEIPLVDLRDRLGHPPAPKDVDPRIAVVDYEGEIYGIPVDSVTEVLHMDISLINDIPAKGNVPGADMLKGIYCDDEKQILILDCSRVFSF